MLTFKHFLRILVLVFMCASVGTTAPFPIQLAMRVTVGTAPATFVVTTTVDNAVDPATGYPVTRAVYVGYRGSGDRSSYYEYNERTNPHTITTWFKDLGCGSYEAWGEIVRLENGKERHYLSVSLPFRVMGVGCELPE